jgi:hypothetical protein
VELRKSARVRCEQHEADTKIVFDEFHIAKHLGGLDLYAESFGSAPTKA